MTGSFKAISRVHLVCGREIISKLPRQVADCLRLLLDPERMNESHKDAFLQLYFDYYIHWMFTPFVEGYGYTLPQPSNRFQRFPDDSSKSFESSEFNPADPVVLAQGKWRSFFFSELFWQNHSRNDCGSVFTTSYLWYLVLVCSVPRISSEIFRDEK